MIGGLVAGSLLAGVHQAAAAQKRIALVIGDAAYEAAPLATAASDAGLIATSLAQAGFDVTATRDADGDALSATVRAFAAKAAVAGPDAVVFVYLTGYGLQRDGDAFFVPVAAREAPGADLPPGALSLTDLARTLAATPAAARIVVLDLARETPFASGGLPLAGGLAPVAAPEGWLYAFNAAPGTVAPPDTIPYGSYARALAEMIATPGLSADALFERVRLRVGELTNGAAIPWSDGKLGAGFVLRPGAPGVPVAEAPSDSAPLAGLSADAGYSAVVARDTLSAYDDFLRVFAIDPLALRVRAIAAARRESLTFAASLRANEPRAYWTYMRRYPRGPHRFDVRRRLARLGAPLEPPPRFDIYDFVDLAPPSVAEVAFVEQPDVVLEDADWPPIPAPPASLLPPPRIAFYDALPPPSLVPPGVLPIAMPVPGGPPAGGSGAIDQPVVPGYGAVRADLSASPGAEPTLTLSSADGTLVSRTTATKSSASKTTFVQSGPEDHVLSRTTVDEQAGVLTIVQTGPTGGVLTKAVTRPVGGGRTTRITDGANRLVAEFRRNAQGIALAVEQGRVPPTVPLPAGAGAGAVQRPSDSKPKPPAPMLKPPTDRPKAPTPPPAKPAAPAANVPAAPEPPKAPTPEAATSSKSPPAAAPRPPAGSPLKPPQASPLAPAPPAVPPAPSRPPEAPARAEPARPASPTAVKQPPAILIAPSAAPPSMPPSAPPASPAAQTIEREPPSAMPVPRPQTPQVLAPPIPLPIPRPREAPKASAKKAVPTPSHPARPRPRTQRR